MKQLFVDTAGLMSMADSNDPLHKACREIRDSWLRQGAVLVTSDYVIDETLTLIRMRLGIAAAEKEYLLEIRCFREKKRALSRRCSC